MLAELFTGAHARASEINVEELVLQTTYHLTTGDQSPLEISIEQFFGLGRMRGADFPGASPKERSSLQEFHFFPRSSVRIGDRAMPLSAEEKKWIENAQVGRREGGAIEEQLTKRLKSELGVDLLGAKGLSKSATRRYVYRGIELRVTEEQELVLDLARRAEDGIVRPVMVAQALGWTTSVGMPGLTNFIKPINFAAVVHTGAPLFENVRGGYKLLDVPIRRFGNAARARMTKVGRQMVSERDAVVLDALNLQGLDGDVQLTPDQLILMNMPLKEVLRALDWINSKAFQMFRRPLVRYLEFRWPGNILRFIYEDERMVGTGCAYEISGE